MSYATHIMRKKPLGNNEKKICLDLKNLTLCSLEILGMKGKNNDCSQECFYMFYIQNFSKLGKESGLDKQQTKVE